MRVIGADQGVWGGGGGRIRGLGQGRAEGAGFGTEMAREQACAAKGLRPGLRRGK